MADERITILQKVVIADGARPLARVGDVIAHGEAIPANVVRFTDRVGDEWKRLTADPATYTYMLAEDDPKRYGSHVMQEYPKWWPMTVVEVDPEPQPARCTNGPDCRRHPDADPEYTHEVDGTRMHRLREPGEVLPPVRSQELAVQYLDEEAESGPVVLSLPQVPDGAVALVGAVRYERSGEDKVTCWRHPSGAVVTLGEVFDNERADGDGSVTVEFAPPREPRVWEQLDPGTDDLQVVECLGMRYTRGSDSLWYGDRTSRTWLQLRAMGEVREVLT